MTKLILSLLLFMTQQYGLAGCSLPRIAGGCKRDGSLYTFITSFETPLTKCAAYHYLTDYEAAKNLPGVVESFA
jgi:hypothetical protein